MIDNKKLKRQIDILKTIAPNASDEIVKLVELYLKASDVMPKKKEYRPLAESDEIQESEVYWYNKAIDECTLVLMKKLEGLEEVIGNTSIPKIYIGEVSQAIRNQFLGDINVRMRSC